MTDEAPRSAIQKLGIGVAAVVQISLAVFAFVDLARRPAEGVRGPKPAWIPVILVNWIGPAAYFGFGIRR
jgi:hypothetical protein